MENKWEGKGEESEEDDDEDNALSEEQHELIVVTALTRTKLPDLADVMVANFSRDQLQELYQLIGERLQARGADTTGGRNPTAVRSQPAVAAGAVVAQAATAGRRGVTA